MAQLRKEALEKINVCLLQVRSTDGREAHMFLQLDVWLVQSPAYALQVRTDVEQSASFGMQTAQDALLLYGYP